MKKYQIKKNSIKLFGVIAFVAVMALTFIGCDMGNDINNTGLIGRWAHIQDPSIEVYHFTADGRILLMGMDLGKTFTVSGNRITTYFFSSQQGTKEFSVSRNQLTLRSVANGGMSGLAPGTFIRIR